MATSVSSPVDVGRALRRARQRRHLGQDEAAQETRIPKRYLEALEANAPIDTYPAPVYARAFLREYACYLEIDPNPLVETFTAGVPEEPQLRAVRDALPPPRRWPARVLLSLSIGVLVVLAVVGIVSSRGSTPPLGRVADTNTQAVPPASGGSQALAPTAPAGPAIRASLQVEQRSWVAATSDGRLAFRGFFLPGHWHPFRADDSLLLKLGNAGGVRLFVNGKHVRTGTEGAVVHLALSIRNGHVHVIRT